METPNINNLSLGGYKYGAHQFNTNLNSSLNFSVSSTDPYSSAN